MAKRIIYTDEKTSNGLEFFVNDEKQLFLQCGQIEGDDVYYYSGWVCLTKSDTEAIIKHLQELLPLM